MYVFKSDGSLFSVVHALCSCNRIYCHSDCHGAAGRLAISKVKCVIYISQQQLQLHSPHSIEQTQMPILQISNVQSHTRVGRFSSARGVSVVHCPFEAKTQIKN